MKYKTKVIFADHEPTTFPLEEYENANKTYESICNKISEHATSITGEWTVQLLMEDDSFYKELKLISKRK